MSIWSPYEPRPVQEAIADFYAERPRQVWIPKGTLPPALPGMLAAYYIVQRNARFALDMKRVFRVDL